MNESLDIRLYSLGKEFLVNRLERKGHSPSLLAKYLDPNIKLDKLSDVYLRLLMSGANSSLVSNVISSPLGGDISNLRTTLFNFDVNRILKNYTDFNAILEKIVSEFDLRVNVTRDGIWYKYSKTIWSGARFLSQFKNYDDFSDFIHFFYKDDRALRALPLLLKEEIDGFGIALSCDFLKELGYHKLGKPDRWIKQIFNQTGLSISNNDFEILKAIDRVANNNSVSAYNVDKLFWLIGSGKFYLDKSQSGKQISIGRSAKYFYDYIACSSMEA
ncbi:MAG TPA: hypothetical protein VI603_11990 [Saprospiraceae bacterium]|nr:hypothetical protein [Saprospiraceae bacterium]